MVLVVFVPIQELQQFRYFLKQFQNGDTVLVENDSYGGTYRLLKVFRKTIHKTIYTDFTNLNLVEEELKNNEIAFGLCESPTNPSLKIIDLEENGKLSKNTTPFCGGQ